jgi:hypothetical protein
VLQRSTDGICERRFIEIIVGLIRYVADQRLLVDSRLLRVLREGGAQLRKIPANVVPSVVNDLRLPAWRASGDFHNLSRRA